MRQRRTALFATIAIALLAIPIQALAAPPQSGSVVEGVSVPGGAVGDTRAAIEASFGSPSFCQSVSAGDLAFCTYNTAEGSASVRYVGANGGDAQASPGDVVHGFNWSGYPGWITTAGVSTASTAQQVVAAYPNATHTVGSFGFESVVSLEEGVSWTRSVNPYFGTVTISMSIFPGSVTDPDPDPGPTLTVESLDLQAKRKAITATVTVIDELGDPVKGAVVEATWTLPGGSEVGSTATTNRRGLAKLSTPSSSGSFVLVIDDVSQDGYTFAGGVVTATIQG